MSENTKPDKPRFSTPVMITLIICATILIITIAGMIFGGIMSYKVIKDMPDKMPDNITIHL